MLKSHIEFDPEQKILDLLDQRYLPLKKKRFICKDFADVCYAIKNMVVRGAPALGVTGAYGCIFALEQCQKCASCDLEKLLDELAEARPTAVNLRWAVNAMREDINKKDSFDFLEKKWLAKAKLIHEQDIRICQLIGKSGANLIKDGFSVYTHCNAGALATGGYGTALGVIRAARQQGKNFSVIAGETRPLFQGSRLTAFELFEDNIPVKVAADNSCAFLMAKNLVDIVITGADRIAANGDAANKIGTLGIAILANYYQIPFYIAAPLSTIDINTSTGSEIPIEERDPEEVGLIGSTRIMPKEVSAYNFAFDVTPANLISGIITEKGILYPPYDESVANVFK